MDATARISSLLRALEQKPSDAFLRYALGVEYTQAGELDRAKSYFVEVRTRHPEYVPTYLQLGFLLESQGELNEARSAYEQGLVAAQAANDSHAASELQSALDAIS